MSTSIKTKFILFVAAILLLSSCGREPSNANVAPKVITAAETVAQPAVESSNQTRSCNCSNAEAKCTARISCAGNAVPKCSCQGGCSSYCDGE